MSAGSGICGHVCIPLSRFRSTKEPESAGSNRIVKLALRMNGRNRFSGLLLFTCTNSSPDIAQPQTVMLR